MSIAYQVLGEPGADNAIFVRITGRQGLYRILFDCGEGCPQALALRDVLGTDALCFSHLHMDHIGGFDTFFRATYTRPGRPMRVYGPPETCEIMHHRFRGFLWNLYAHDPGVWYVSDVHPDRVSRLRFETHEAFAVAHPAGERPISDGVVIVEPGFSIQALLMNHQTPSLAYILREQPRLNVAPERLVSLGLPAGRWLEALKYPPEGSDEIEVAGERYPLAELRAALVVERPGDSLAYLTDFLLDDDAMARLVPALEGVGTIVCESQYLDADIELARRHHHMTASQAARLARAAGAGELILFHLSDRYRPDTWLAMLTEARAVFPNTRFPAHWALDE
ncbi:MAG TPA: MBL fold metallo-hydrolase [Ktedonobacterales bacterium]|nr:MBL fold metallo-hydrolase [Ktedonobacterales bacterium]